MAASEEDSSDLEVKGEKKPILQTRFRFTVYVDSCLVLPWMDARKSVPFSVFCNLYSLLCKVYSLLCIKRMFFQLVQRTYFSYFVQRKYIFHYANKILKGIIIFF